MTRAYITIITLTLLLSSFGCSTLSHSVFNKAIHHQSKEGSNYTVWKVNEYSKKDSTAIVELWVMNIEPMTVAEYQTLEVIQKKDSTRYKQRPDGRYYFEVKPGKYSFYAGINDIPPGSITTKPIKVRKGDFLRIVMLYVEDWGTRKNLLDQDWRKESDKALKQALENIEREKQQKGGGND